MSFQLPHEHETNHHRVAGLVVDLYRLHIEVSGTHGQLLGTEERVYPIESYLGESSLIFAEEKHHPSLVGFELHHSAPHYNRHEQEHTAAYTGSDALGGLADVDAKHNESDAQNCEKQVDEKHKKAVDGHSLECEFLIFHKCVVIWLVLF